MDMYECANYVGGQSDMRSTGFKPESYHLVQYSPCQQGAAVATHRAGTNSPRS